MAGAGYKLFNTGDVLTAAQVNTYLMEQTVMVFADAAARTAALTGVVSEGMISYLKDTNAVEVYNGSAWVASDDPNAIQNTIVDAKGDLITATANDTPARLAVGNNGETLVADSSASTGLRYSAGVGFTQPIINGGMDVWQRGTSVSIAGSSSGYTADRWAATGGANAMTVSRQATGDTTNLPFIQYCARVQRNSGQTSTNGITFVQSLETVNSVPFAGKTVTMSFYARAGANFSAASSQLTAFLITGTGTDQNRLNGAYTGDIANSLAAILTTTWQRFNVTVSLPTNTNEIASYFIYTPSGTAGANDYFEITGVQIDVGSTALPFRRAGGTLAGELAACRRYFQLAGSGCMAQAFSTTGLSVVIPFNVPMRTTPSILGNGQATILRFGVTTLTTTTWTPGSVGGTTNGAYVDVATNAAGWAFGDRVALYNDCLTLSSEL